MEAVNFVIIEDRKDWRDTIREFMKDEGHIPVGEATNPEEADSLSRKIADGETEPVDVAFLDNDLKNEGEPDPNAEKRATLLANAGVVVISISGRWPINGCIDTGKDVEEILKVINNL